MKKLRTATVTLVACAALAAGSAVAWQEAQVAKLAPLIGKWDATLEVFGAPEVAGLYQGTVTFSWAPNKRNVRAEAKLTTEDGDLFGTGFIGFDDNGPIELHRYRGAFMWDGDARILVLEGALNGKHFGLKGSPISSDKNKDLEFSVKTDFGEDQFTVVVHLHDRKEPAIKVLEIRFRRAKD